MNPRLSCRKSLLLLLAIAGYACHAADNPPQGLTFKNTRLIYPASAKGGVTLSVENNTRAPYLVQSWVQAADPLTGQPFMAEEHSPRTPFIILPPLKRLEPGEATTLRVRLTGSELPTDRESVFFMSIKAIPSQNEAQSGADISRQQGQLVVSTVNNLKLFYRPADLPAGGVAETASQLRFYHRGEQLIVKNPTPFYLTFSRLAIGGVQIERNALYRMVPPKGEQDYPWPETAVGEVTWQLIDEYADETALQHQSVNTDNRG